MIKTVRKIQKERMTDWLTDICSKQITQRKKERTEKEKKGRLNPIE